MIPAALFRREQWTRGKYMDCSLWDAEVSALAGIASNGLVPSKEPQRWGTTHVSSVRYQT